MSDAVRSHAAASAVTLVLRVIVSAIVIAIPMVIDFTALDAWRIPKIAVFRAAVVVLTAVAIAAALVFPRSLPRIPLRRNELVVLASILALSILTTFITTDRVHSLSALITVVCSIAFFVIATMTLRGQSLAVTLSVIAVPAIANTIFVAAQAWNIWNPLRRVAWLAPEDVRTGFLGNPNFVGSFMVTPTLVLLVATVVFRSNARLFCAAALFLSGLGFVLSRTLTAFIAFVAAATVLAVIRWRRNALLAGLAVIVLALLAVATYRPLRARLNYIREVASQGKYDRIFSGRLVAFSTAVEMIRAHPLLGVGLGNFERNYMEYNRPALRKYPALKRSTTRGVNFGEAHNEPLQYWAETGVLGFVLFFAALALLTMRARGASSLIRVLAPSYATLVLVLSLGQFPFHLPASLVMNLYVGAFCFAHDPRD